MQTFNVKLPNGLSITQKAENAPAAMYAAMTAGFKPVEATPK